MERQRELDYPQIRSDVPAIPGRHGNELFANFLRELRQLRGSEALDIGRTANRRQKSGRRRGNGFVHLYGKCDGTGCQSSRLASNFSNVTEPSFCFLSCSIFNSASLSRPSQIFSSLVPSSNFTMRSASGTSPDSIDSTMVSSLPRASSNESLASAASTAKEHAFRQKLFKPSL